MSEYLILGETLEEIADAIREKTGGTDEMFPADMAGAIRGIQSVGFPDGLPDGVSALATGTYTPTSTIYSHEIAHGLGVEPNFYIVVLENNTSEDVIISTTVISFGLRKYIKSSSYGTTVIADQGLIIGYNSSGSRGLMSFSKRSDENIFNSTRFIAVTPSSTETNTHNMKVGYTYRWVCGVLDGFE